MQKGLLISAIRDNDPVVYLGTHETIIAHSAEEVPEGEYTVPLRSSCSNPREGKDVSVITLRCTWFVKQS